MNVFDYLFAESGSLEKDFVLGTHHHISFEKLHGICSKVSTSLKTVSYTHLDVYKRQLKVNKMQSFLFD